MSGDLASFAGALGAGLVVIGAGFGIGKLAASALDGTARQPEAGGRLFVSMIVAGALIEGLGFFALIQCGNAIKNGPEVAKIHAAAPAEMPKH